MKDIRVDPSINELYGSKKGKVEDGVNTREGGIPRREAQEKTARPHLHYRLAASRACRY